MQTNNIHIQLHKEIATLRTQKDELSQYLDIFKQTYLSQLYPLIQNISLHKVNILKKKFTTINECHTNLEEEFKLKRKVYITLNRTKEQILKKLQHADISEYKSCFEELTNTQIKVQYMKNELLDLKQLIKHINPKKHQKEFEQYKKEYIDFCNQNKKTDTKETGSEELKQLYKQASKLCHPDMVHKTYAQEAQKTFQELNNSYMKKDLKEIQQIYNYLNLNNPFFKNSADKSITELKEEKKKLITEIESIKTKNPFSYAFKIQNMKIYFKNEETKLQNQLTSLKNKNIEDEDYILSKIYNWVNLHKLDYQTFPRNIKKLKELEYLNLRNKKIIYLLSEIYFLKKLKKINLSTNTIAKLPDNLGKLKSLEYLDLSHNQLDKLPKTIINLTNLKYLNLRSNIFTKIPSHIGMLVSLKSIDFSDNQIVHFSKEMFSLKYLEELYFNENKLKLLPKNINVFENLKIVEFGDNYIRNISKDLYKLKKLTILSLWGNYLKFIPSNISKLTFLQELNLGSNSLEILPNDIINMKMLNNLNITFNKNLKLSQEQQNWQKLINGNII